MFEYLSLERPIIAGKRQEGEEDGKPDRIECDPVSIIKGRHPQLID